MKLITEEQERRLLAQVQANAGRKMTKDYRPVVKLYCTWYGATWLLSEVDPPRITTLLLALGSWRWRS